jgi:hypothetical protein
MMIQRIELAHPSDPWAIRSVDFGPYDRTLLVGRHSPDGWRRLAEIEIQSQAWGATYDSALDGAATCVRYADSYRSIVYLDERANARVIETADTDQQRPLLLAEGVRHISGAREAPVVALSGARCEIRRLTGEVLWAPGNQPAWSANANLALDASGRTAAHMANNAAELRWLDLQSYQSSRSVVTALAGALSVEMDARGRWVSVIGAGMQGCGVWSSITGAAAGEIFCHPEQNNNTCHALHPLRDLAAFGTIAGYVVVVDLKGNDILYMEGLHESRVWDLAFSADGRHLAAAGDDGTITVMPLEEVETLGTSQVRV